MKRIINWLSGLLKDEKGTPSSKRFIGIIAGWLWWSYSVPRWRKWALEQPGVDPNELQAAAEAALLVWPKGHFFEKTEIKIKEK